MAKKFNVAGEQHYEITGQILEIQQQLRLEGGSPLDPEYVKRALQDIIQPKHDDKEENTIPRLLSRGENIIIPACDGSKTIANAEDVFACIDSDFKNRGLNKPGSATAETVIDVHELIRSVDCAQMFGSLGADLDKLCLAQHQIIEFCKQHTDWLCANGYVTLFLFKVDGQFLIARVCEGSDGMVIDVGRLGRDALGDVHYHRRVVVPQLGSQEL